MATVTALLQLSSQLAPVSDSPRLDVELLLCHCLQKPRSFLRTWPERKLTAAQQQQFDELLQRRQEGEPIAYLTGERGFWTLDLAVSASTLIPRPETELLVEHSLRLLAGRPQATVLDLGTGTGAIALALASEHPGWHIDACDVQPDAVALAEHNRVKHQLSNVRLFQSDWFTVVPAKRYQLIVSNPPYIDATDQHLQQGDVRFEPLSALVAERQGMADIETIITGAGNYLASGAWLLIEHGFEQAQAVQACFTAVGFSQVFSAQDLAGLDRVTGGQLIIASGAAADG
ncbi:MAG: release factor glutamine methyltransferase [Oceanicoccus sp.]|jgi:release factor glutamine methyltransferase